MLAEDWLMAVDAGSPSVFAALAMEMVSYQLARKRMNRILSDLKACEAAWYLLDSEDGPLLEAHLGIRGGQWEPQQLVSALTAASKRRRTSVVGFQVLATGDQLDGIFLADLRAAFGLPLPEAQILVARHVELNGHGTIHVTDGFLLDEGGNHMDKATALSHIRRQLRQGVGTESG